MHYRFRGNNIQVVRSQPDPATGKAKSVPLGSINRATLMISDKLRENCSADELAEIKGWVKRYQSVYQLKRKHAALTLPEHLETAIDWFEEASIEEARQVVDDVLFTVAALRRTLNKRGLL
jgi:hypothetical protein